jgi:hypothetical protein
MLTLSNALRRINGPVRSNARTLSLTVLLHGMRLKHSISLPVRRPQNGEHRKVMTSKIRYQDQERRFDMTLLASSGTLEGTRKQIAKFWCCEPDDIELMPKGVNIWTVQKKGKEMWGTQVSLKKCRFHFELCKEDNARA